MAFEQHLRDAIRINRDRRRVYAPFGGAGLSRALVFLERLSLPIARAFERLARTQRRRALLELTFVPMKVARAESPTLYRGLGGRAQRRAARRLLGQLARNPRRARQVLGALIELEELHGAHLAMSRHLVESVGRSQAVIDRLDMGGDRFARALLAVQLAALPLAIPLDARAQRVHARGGGILVNDLPAIVF